MSAETDGGENEGWTVVPEPEEPWAPIEMQITDVRAFAPPGEPTCESCGQRAEVLLNDDSWWCWACDAAAHDNGYDDGGGRRSETVHALGSSAEGNAPMFCGECWFARFPGQRRVLDLTPACCDECGALRLCSRPLDAA